ncbi:MAG: hypothetical protein GMKNLPBB_01775 [Myxococcota bacterium]|nr:hypothetical protein [Myxococcota bacterium]
MPRIVIVHGREIVADLYFQPNKESIAIGRNKIADIVIDDPEISRRHATIIKNGDKYVIREIDAKNGLHFRGARIGEHVLSINDEIDLGKYTLIFKGEAPDEWGVTAEQQAKQVVQGGRVEVRAKASRQLALPTVSTKHVGEKDLVAVQQALRQKRQAYLDVIENGVVKLRLAIEKDRYVFGRGGDADVEVGGWFAPRVTAAIEHSGGKYVLRVPDGEKEVFVNGRPPTSDPLNEGDQLNIRGKRFVFHDRIA